MLNELWADYKVNNIEPNSNRTIDKSQNNITTSEGQSYTMLRAVWQDDRTTFDESWEFTKNNMQRPQDNLFSWKYGQKLDGSYGILTDIGGQNTASDADADIALSLMMAYSRWNDAKYLYQAKQIITSIWNEEVVMVAGKPVMTADDLEKNAETEVVVNPSYFAPSSYKLFAKVDPSHDWTGLADHSYDLLNQLSEDTLGSTTSSKLPPNWIKMNIETGAFVPATQAGLDTNYGFDALRIPFRMALDYAWNKDERAKIVLQHFGFLDSEWQSDNKLQAIYAHDGTVVGNYETPAMYGGSIGYFKLVQPEAAKEIYQQKLQTLYNPDTQKARTNLSYYDSNWAWFGIALMTDNLPNLALENY
jgi:endoglucanase